jgi:hypothetical protein
MSDTAGRSERPVIWKHSRRDARVRLFFLSVERAEELRAHLEELLFGDQLVSAVAAIDFAAALLVSPGTAVEHRAWARADREHKAAVAEAADELRRLLDVQLAGGRQARPLVSTAGIDWHQFETTLARVAASARLEASLGQPASVGHPPDDARDALVSVIYSVYPSGSATRTRGSHFERTVALVLDWCGRGIKGVHKLIHESLARKPEPPLTVRRTRRR